MTTGVPAAAAPPAEGDLGFGARVAERSRIRLLNRDGSFNVRRTGLPWYRSHSLYHMLLTTTWVRFFSLVVGLYIAANLVFAAAYLACGPGALQGGRATSTDGRAIEAFFFSVHTLATIGYGTLSPVGLAANLIVTVESVVGLVGIALASGLSFARFSRPAAWMMFSRNALVAPYRGGTGFMFRVANGRSNQVVSVEVQVVLTRRVPAARGRGRSFEPLALERSGVMFLPLHWVVVHPITPGSPLHGVTAEELLAQEAEFLILLSAVDETFAQTVHARTSYRAEDVVWNVKFSDMFVDVRGELAVDLRRLDAYEPAS